MDNTQARYYLEHVLLPELFYGDKKEFIDALLDEGRNLLYKFIESICKENGIECQYKSNQYKTITYGLGGGYQMVKAMFPEPEKASLCSKAYFVFDETFKKIKYFTIEKSFAKGNKSIFYLCTWNENLQHINYGQVPNGIEEQDRVVAETYFQAI